MVGVVKLHVEKMEKQKVIAIGSFVCVCVSTGLACELKAMTEMCTVPYRAQRS